MPRVLPNHRLNRIAKANREAIEKWKEGESLVRDSRHAIADLLLFAAADRWRLARLHDRHARRLLTIPRPEYRAAISRYYYAMYHAMRACVFIDQGGDDHESHTDLPLHVPSDFPSSGWQNKLKDARLTRNQADYEPYPLGAGSWKVKARALKADAELLLKDARVYLRRKGCRL